MYVGIVVTQSSECKALAMLCMLQKEGRDAGLSEVHFWGGGGGGGGGGNLPLLCQNLPPLNYQGFIWEGEG